MRRSIFVFFISAVLIVFFVSLNITENYDRWSFEDPLFVRSLADIMFLVGLIMFLFSIIIVTGASDVFIAIGYTFKNIFRRHRVKYGTYHDYMKSRQDDEGTKMTGISPLIISIIYLSIAFYLSYFVI